MSSQPIKLIFAGLDQAGKTTIYAHTMEEMSAAELQNTRPTRGIERHAHDYLDTDFQVWDLGGQLNYRETYLSKPEVFNQTKCLIFVVDIQDIDRIESAYEYYVDILNILKNVDPLPKLYVLFHKFDPDKAGKLKSHFYRATRLFRKADNITRHKFKGYATSIYSNSIDLAVKRILFANFDDFEEPRASLKVKSKVQLKEEKKTVPKPKEGAMPTPPSSAPTPSKVPSSAPSPSKVPSSAPSPSKTPSISKTIAEEAVVEKAAEEKAADEALKDATPTGLLDLSEEVASKLTSIINKRMKDSDEIVALSILSSDGKQALAVGKTEIDYDRIATLREVVSSLNPKQFFKDLTDIEYRGLGHFSLSDFDIYFARASDDYAIAVLATDVSTAMLQNAQRIVRSIRQGLGIVSEDGEDLDVKKKKPKGKKDLVADLRNRLKALSGIDEI